MSNDASKLMAFFDTLLGKALVIFCFAFLLYANTFQHDYAWDDYAVIVNNQHTQAGFAGIPKIFTEKVYLPERESYRPVAQSSFAIEVAVFGNNPHVGHFFNVLLYAFTCVTLFYFLQLLFGASAKWLPFYASLLFVVLPVHSESVANIKSRDELLMLFFGLWSLIFIAKGIATVQWRWLAAALCMFTISALSKENAITLLGIAPLVFAYVQPEPVEWLKRQWHSRRIVFTGISIALTILFLMAVSLRFQALALYNIALLLVGWVVWSWVNAQNLKQKFTPLLVCLGIIGIAALFIWQVERAKQEASLPSANADTAIQPTAPPEFNRPVEPLNNTLIGASSLSQKVATMVVVLGKYLQLLIVPITLVYHYGFNQLPITDFADYRVWVIALLHLCLILYAVFGLRQKRIIGFGILFYFITLSVYTHITMLLPATLQIPLGSNYVFKVYAHLYNVLPDTLAERFLLLPSVGFCMAMVYAIGVGTQKFFEHERRDTVNNYGFALVMGILLFFNAAKTFSRNQVWKNNETLFTSDIENMPDNAIAHVNYAKVWLNKLQNTRSKEQALNYFKKYEAAQLRALEIYPKFLSARLDLGNAYFNFGMFDKALPIFEQTIVMFKDDPAPYFALGQFYYEQEKYDEAIPHLEKALNIEQYYPEAYRLLAWSYYNAKKFQPAQDILLKGAALYVQKSQFHTLSAHFYLLQSQFPQAITAAEKAIAINPSDKTAYLTLSQAYDQSGNSTEALKYRQIADGLK